MTYVIEIFTSSINGNAIKIFKFRLQPVENHILLLLITETTLTSDWDKIYVMLQHIRLEITSVALSELRVNLWIPIRNKHSFVSRIQILFVHYLAHYLELYFHGRS